MRDMIVNELTQAVQELARGFAHFLPRLIEMLVFALVGWVVAFILKFTLRAILRLARFDKLSESSGVTHLLTQAALPSSTELLCRFVFWIAWLGFFLVGLSVMGIVGLQDHIFSLFLFLPRLFVALLIVFFGLLAASFVSRATLLAAVNANLPSPRFLSLSIRIMIIIFVLSMVFEELGVAERTMELTFGIAFGALMLGLAIAFGWGGRRLAQRFLETRFPPRTQDEKEDELSPL